MAVAEPTKWMVDEAFLFPVLERRARIAAALISRLHHRRAGLPDEDLASVACTIDREIEEITRGEIEQRARERA